MSVANQIAKENKASREKPPRGPAESDAFSTPVGHPCYHLARLSLSRQAFQPLIGRVAPIVPVRLHLRRWSLLAVARTPSSLIFHTARTHRFLDS